MPWATDTGGSITLRKPLTLQQLQAGGLILSVKVDGNDPVDVSCIVGMVGDQVQEIKFVNNNLDIFYVNNPSQYAGGVFQINSSGEHSHTYQVVSVKLPENVVLSTNPVLPLQPTGPSGSIEVTLNKPISDRDIGKIKIIVDNILLTAVEGSTWSWGNYISTNHASGEVSTIVLNYNGDINEVSGIFLYD